MAVNFSGKKLTSGSLENNTDKVDVSTANPPTTDQVLTATSSTTAIWKTPSNTKMAFHAYRSTAYAVPPNSAFIDNYDTVIYNSGVGFDPVTGRFTAQVAGYYSFVLTVLLTALPSTDNIFITASFNGINPPHPTGNEPSLVTLVSAGVGRWYTTIRTILLTPTQWVHAMAPTGTLGAIHFVGQLEREIAYP